MLTELTAVPTAGLPVLQFRDHLRMGTGFADDGSGDGLFEPYLRAAVAAVEAWTGKALLARQYRLEVSRWRAPDAQPLPVAPVTAIARVALAGPTGDETVVAADRYRLEADMHRPVLRSTGSALPTIPAGHAARIEFTAGFGPAWSDIPNDLAHAVLMLGAYYHEYRYEARIGAQEIPFGVSRLISGWRALRIGGGEPR